MITSYQTVRCVVLVPGMSAHAPPHVSLEARQTIDRTMAILNRVSWRAVRTDHIDNETIKRSKTADDVTVSQGKLASIFEALK